MGSGEAIAIIVVISIIAIVVLAASATKKEDGGKRKEVEEAERLLARIASVKSAKIIGTVVSTEGHNGNMTNYIMHTVRLIYQDGSIGLVTLRETDPFLQGIISKLEN